MPATKKTKKNAHTKPARRSYKKLSQKPSAKKVSPKKRILKFKRKSSMALLILIFTVLFILWYMFHAVDLATQAINSTVKDAGSMLAYDKSQVETAKIVGSKSQLAQEIQGYSRGSLDLQSYITKDYKQFKQKCVVNGDLVGPVSYEVVKVVNNKFALVAKGCNGVEDNILARIGGRWSVVYSGNTLIACELVNSLDIPQSISRYCSLNDKTYLNPNP